MSSKDSQLTAGALFAGIGGFCVGFQNQGIKTTWAVENDFAAVDTYSANVGSNIVVHKDGAPQSILDVSVKSSNLCPVDVLHAGFPCQSFSVAGERKGFDDPRGQLFYEIIRILREFGENRPSVLLLENSPNIRIGAGGSWFLELSAQIKKAGYWFRESNAFELDSFDHTAVPQKRKRLFMVAFATNKFKNGNLRLNLPKFAEHKQVSEFINFEGEIEDNSYYLDKNNKYYKMITEKIDHPKSILQLRKYEVRDKGVNIVPTLTANMGQGGHNVPFIVDKKGLRKLTEYECLKIQGFPDDYFFPESVPRAKRYQQIGNSVVPPLISLIAAAIKEKIEEERL
ncbi:DNA (cytosine-5-)-methyltransferase [Massilia sp. IC2-278]|uniref:DNA cytosine methyltransferase n=1 Tax=Massilia sp. IC2-278 TaxID=2887200 RepID=UPI001E318473|nr:DNA (cytosine-5-)-methyltransferase [Massilia sp. IC2-278]MCC2963464.1 DNA (cytosine-5-)-methyltransferase [Massilia sp. IC2-278]